MTTYTPDHPEHPVLPGCVLSEGRFFLNSFRCLVLLSGGPVLVWLSSLCSKGIRNVDGRGHGLGCTAASYTGATQWHSLQDSPGRPCAAKPAYMARAFSDQRSAS